MEVKLWKIIWQLNILCFVTNVNKQQEVKGCTKMGVCGKTPEVATSSRLINIIK